MDEDEEMEELRAQEARRVREEAKKCLRNASFQLGKAAYEIDDSNDLPNLGIAEMARVQVQLALRRASPTSADLGSQHSEYSLGQIEALQGF